MTTQTLTTGTVIERTDRREEKTLRHASIPRPCTVKRIRRFVEDTDWDERVLEQERRFDVASIGLLLLATTLLVPLFIQAFRG